MVWKTILVVQLGLACAAVAAGPILGALGNDPRTADNRIDIPLTIEALQSLNANTFFYLIYQDKHDWDDLPAFADAAAKVGISVWVYIVPWSETPPHKRHGWGYSEPYRNDYVRWSSAIATLSLAHPNIAGWVIDDFFSNTLDPGHFSTEYVREMTLAAKRINPDLKFYPLMYAQTPWANFLDGYASYVDGVVLAYPQSELEVRNALTYLDDRRHGPSVIFELPRKDGAHEGDRSIAACDVMVTDPTQAELSFYYDFTDSVGNGGDHVASVRLDGRTIWEAHTAHPRRDGVVSLDLSRLLIGKRRARLEFELRTARTGVPEEMPVIARFDDIRMYGMGSKANPFAEAAKWRVLATGKFHGEISPASTHGRRFKLPVILMPCGESEQFQKRYDLPGTPENIARSFAMCGELLGKDLVEGIVGYRIPLVPQDPNLLAVKRVYEKLRREIRKQNQ